MTINEGTSAILELAFTGINGKPEAPLTCRYRIDDYTSGGAIAAWADLAVSSATVQIPISNDQNSILDPASSEEIKVVTIEANYAGGGVLTTEYRYTVINLQHLP